MITSLGSLVKTHTEPLVPAGTMAAFATTLPGVATCVETFGAGGELCDALQAVSTLDARYRRVLKHFLDQLDLNELQAKELQEELAESLKPHSDQVERLAEVPGLGVDSAQQIIAEVGPTAEKFPSAADLSSWVGVCPGQNESAEESTNAHSPKGNQALRRIRARDIDGAVRSVSFFVACF